MDVGLMPKTEPKDDPRFLSSVERGFLVLDALAETTGPMSLTELSKATGLAVPTLQRLTATLVKTGYLEKEPSSKRYRAAVKTVDLLYSYLSRNQFAKRAWPHLVKLREDLGLDVSLSVPFGNSMIYVHRLPGYSGNFENTLPGRRVPIHLSASGRCVLSFLEPSQIRTTLGSLPLSKLTPWSKVDIEEIQSEIAKCRKHGYAVVEQEASPGTVTLAAPVTRASSAIAGVSVHSPTAGGDFQSIAERVLPSVISVSRAISVN
ncbi:MAG: IclR family transcriptional regulator [Pseudomonadota bacterium]